MAGVISQVRGDNWRDADQNANPCLISNRSKIALLWSAAEAVFAKAVGETQQEITLEVGHSFVFNIVLIGCSADSDVLI